MASCKEIFEPFDSYCAGMGFIWCESRFLWRNYNEEFLKLSDYGITKQDVWRYEQLIKQRHQEAAERHKTYEHRSNFFKVLAVLSSCLSIFIVVLIDDFMRESSLLFDILHYLVCIGLIWGL